MPPQTDLGPPQKPQISSGIGVGCGCTVWSVDPQVGQVGTGTGVGAGVGCGCTVWSVDPQVEQVGTGTGVAAGADAGVGAGFFVGAGVTAALFSSSPVASLLVFGDWVELGV